VSSVSRSRNGLGGDVPEADFWPGIISGEPVTYLLLVANDPDVYCRED
jgi:hypothetical protein